MEKVLLEACLEAMKTGAIVGIQDMGAAGLACSGSEMPARAGTGAEVTRNAVLASPEHRVKVSLRSPLMLPRVALVDPELTYDLPPDLTASTGLDALTQLIEPYVCLRASSMTDGLCVEGIRRAARSLRVAFTDGGNQAARADMAARLAESAVRRRSACARARRMTAVAR